MAAFGGEQGSQGMTDDPNLWGEQLRKAGNQDRQTGLGGAVRQPFQPGPVDRSVQEDLEAGAFGEMGREGLGA